MLKLIHNSAEYLKKATDFQPEIGIVLGTGLGGLVNEIKAEKSISYKEIPNFPVSTVEGHQGELIFGLLGNKKVIAIMTAEIPYNLNLVSALFLLFKLFILFSIFFYNIQCNDI